MFKFLIKNKRTFFEEEKVYITKAPRGYHLNKKK